MFNRDLDPGLLLLIAVGAFAAHTVFLALARRINMMSLLGGAYMLLSPTSGASALPVVGIAKYGRVYVTVLLPIVGLLFARAYRMGLASWCFLIFVIWYVISAFWSEQPFGALLYKGNWAVLVVGGLMVAASIRDRHDFYIALRTLSIASGFFALLAISELVLNPASVSHLGRLAVWGMNPNRVGQTASPMLIIAVCVALQDPSRAWRTYAYGVAGVLAVLILYTGSRGALGSAVIGVFAMASLYVRRPARLAAVLAVIVVAVYITQQFAQTTAITRFASQELVLRDEPWDLAMERFRESPLFGAGWVYREDKGDLGTTTNLHGMYMQILAETGIVGIGLLALMLFFIGLRGLKMFWTLRPHPAWAVPSHFSLGLFGSVMAHAVVESGPIVGGQIGGFALAFGLGLIDKLPFLAKQEEHQWIAYAYEQGWYPGYEELTMSREEGFYDPAYV